MMKLKIKYSPGWDTSAKEVESTDLPLRELPYSFTVSSQHEFACGSEIS